MSSVLNVNSALRRDSGDYWCTSKNQYGHSTRLIRLNVRGVVMSNITPDNKQVIII